MLFLLIIFGLFSYTFFYNNVIMRTITIVIYRGGKNMKKEKREKMSFIGFLTASIIYFIASILNFIDKNTGTAVMFLCLGFSFLCLATTHLDKDKSKDKNNKQE